LSESRSQGIRRMQHDQLAPAFRRTLFNWRPLSTIFARHSMDLYLRTIVHHSAAG
jgi:hypothetical protein